MVSRGFGRIAIAAAILAASPSGAYAQDDHAAVPAELVELVVEAGRPLRVALDERVNVKRVGQPVEGTLIDPLYSYDRAVVPAGTKVRGHVTALEPFTKKETAESFAAGQFGPRNRVVVGFDALVLGEGHVVPIHTAVNRSADRLTISASPDDAPERGGDHDRTGIVDQGREAVAQARRDALRKAHAALDAIRQPAKMDRAKAAVISRLPYHPQYLMKGSVYDAQLLEALDFGSASATAAAPAGSVPAPNSVLNARLATPLDSSKVKRGDRVEAIVTEPVFSAEHYLILPEGSRLIGEVTVAKESRHWHRSGQLRFLFESVQPPKQDIARMLASLYSVQVADAGAVAIDEEGGTRGHESNTRFIAPALAVLALTASTHHEERRFDHDADDSTPGPAGSPLSRGVGGFFGWSIAGAVVSQVWHPAGIALAAVGVARTTYTAVIAKGHDVTFPADTIIQVQLAPGPAKDR